MRDTEVATINFITNKMKIDLNKWPFIFFKVQPILEQASIGP